MSKLVNVSVKVPKEVREQMNRVKVNWSSYLREAIERKIKEELAVQASKLLDDVRRSTKDVEIKRIVEWIREDRGR
jgi:predicted DNA-binding protein